MLRVKEIDSDREYNVSFLVYDDKYKHLKEGDIIEGRISINLVFYKGRINKDIMFTQNIPKSPHVDAVV